MWYCDTSDSSHDNKLSTILDKVGVCQNVSEN